MIQVIGIGGEPASGKTTLLYRLLDRLAGVPLFQKAGLLRWMEFQKSQVAVLGQYPPVRDAFALPAEAKFAGTDTLSMAVQPVAVEKLIEWEHDPLREGWTVIFEGDRLFNGKFYEALIRWTGRAEFFILTAPPELIDGRHTTRGDRQASAFIKGRRTKLLGMESTYKLPTWPNLIRADVEKNLARLEAMIWKFRKERLDVYSGRRKTT